MEDLYMNFTIAISRLNKIIQRIKSYEISKYNLQPIHVSCAYYLSKSTNGLTAKELSIMAIEDKAAVSRALKTLQERGFVEYVPHGRNEVVRLTAAGENFARIVCEKINIAVEAGSADITESERKLFYDSLLEISNKLIKYYQNLTEKQ